MARVNSLITDLLTRSLKLNIDMAVGCLQNGLSVRILLCHDCQLLVNLRGDPIIGSAEGQIAWCRQSEEIVRRGCGACDGKWTTVDDNFCMKGHDLKEQMSKRLFNCVAKNLCKELTAAANPTSERPVKKRKIAKLTSKLKND